MASGDINIDGIQISPEGLTRLVAAVTQNIEAKSNDPEQIEVIDSLTGVTSIPVLQQIGNTVKLVRVLVSILRGVDGREVFLQVTETHIQWRYTDGMWDNLIALADLKGDKGETPIFRTNSDGIQWKYDGEGEDAWKGLVSYEILKMKFSDLTAEQIQTFWHSLPEDMLDLFQQPATDAAKIALAAASVAEETNAQIIETENLRVGAESSRVEAEKSRVSLETDRIEAERIRNEAETLRKETENTRLVEEARRGTAEEERKANELVRQEQETAREQETTAAILAAETAIGRLNTLSDHREEIRDGYWWRWNEETGEWYHTGEIAKGNVMFATFEIDPLTGRLTMFTDPEYTGANFELDENGKLQVII